MSPQKIRIASTHDFEQQPMRAFELDDVNIVLVKSEGQFFALEDRCSHADFKLSDGDCTTERITCPAHGASFCLKSGKPLSLPALLPVKTFPVSVVGEEIFVEIDGVA